MADSDWKVQLTKLLIQLAGGDALWLLKASDAVSKKEEFTQRLILELPNTQEARKFVDALIGRSAHEDPPGDESTSGREKAAGGVVYVQVILRQAGQPVKVQLASEEEAEAAAPLNGSEVACVSELTLQTLKVPPPPATSAVYVDPGGNSLPVHIRLPATEQEYLALPPQLISDNSRDKPLRLIVCKSGMWAPANIVNLFTKLLNMVEPLNKLTGLTNAIIAVVLVVRGVK